MLSKTGFRFHRCRVPLFFALSLMLLCLAVKILTPIPLTLMHRLRPSDVFPPLWLFNLLSMLWYFLLGFAAGSAFDSAASGRAGGRGEIRIYKGGLFFVALLFLSLIWYPLFFIGERFFLALLLVLLSIASSVLCAVIWSKHSVSVGITVAAFALWQVYSAFLNLSVFFCL